ncbi:MAG: hypothetical protein JF630_07480 [Geodermatophilales bacterium]|nr:hypothetical protein [Geodermatophilales bacterium]
MASTVTGLPDRYRPLDQVGPEEQTPTGVIRCWRAKDRVLNRDVAIRVHTPAGRAAHAWISRALTAGGLATPALAMVYDAAEGSDDPQAPGGAAYVVNEWIDGETLAERLASGPMPEREVRTVLRRLAEGVAEAHRVGLAVGGLTPDNVVLRPNGLVGLRAVPAATGSIDTDVTALGDLLEACLTGLDDGATRPLTGPSDLVALARRARSSEPGQGLSSVAAMAALLADRPRTGPGAVVSPHRGEEPDSGWLRRRRERRTESLPRDAAPPAAPGGSRTARHAAHETRSDAQGRLDPATVPPVPNVRPLTGPDTALSRVVLGGDTIDAGSVAPDAGAYAGRVEPGPVPPHRHARPDDRWADEGFDAAGYDEPLMDLGYGDDDAPADDADIDDHAGRHRLMVIGLPLLALAVVIALAWWVGSNVLSVAGSVDQVQGSTPSASVPAPAPAPSPVQKPASGAPVPIVSASVFDPEGDGQPENDREAPLAYDGNPDTAWSTVNYRGSPAFGNLKSGVGLLLDLGKSQALSGVTVRSTRPGASLEIRTSDQPADTLDAFATVASGTVQDSTDLGFDKPVTARFVLVWITGLVDGPDGFSANIAEVVPHSAG